MCAGLDTNLTVGLDIMLVAAGWDGFVHCKMQDGKVYAYTLQEPEEWDMIAMPSGAAVSALAAGEKHR